MVSNIYLHAVDSMPVYWRTSHIILLVLLYHIPGNNKHIIDWIFQSQSIYYPTLIPSSNVLCR
jgi:hypothetical protein